MASDDKNTQAVNPFESNASTAKGLRDLAFDIKAACEASTVLGPAASIINNAADHLCAIAHIHELNLRG